MRSQEELRKVYAEEIMKAWDSPKMQDYCIKKAAYIVELDNGDIAAIEKPSIETRFCFGYGYCGRSDEESERAAYDEMREAETKAEYFISENMKPLDSKLDLLKKENGGDHWEAVKRPEYSGTDNLKGIEFIHRSREKPASAVDISDGERAAMIAGYEEVRKGFAKRLNTYLKRYGLTKLDCWTYLRD